MSFQSLHFLLFALMVFGLNSALLNRADARKNMLLAASYYFYMCWDWRFAGLLFAVAAINFVAARQISNATSRRSKNFWLTIGVALSLGILVTFKYANFFIDTLAAILTQMGINADLPTLNVLLPIGISFFTFQGIAYTIDVYRDQQEPSTDFRDFALFIAFFPTVLSGPITRGRQLLPQFSSLPPYRSEAAQEGIYLILRGLAKKIFLADILAAHIVNPTFTAPHNYSTTFLLVAVVAYSFQIYMDLSGYTDIARGVAKALGFELPENFRRPYQASSVSNFWQRWHISMSSFFRDYLYFGVGGSKRGNVYRNLLITFVAIGMWHGAGWNFIVYGLLHGSAVSLERFFRNRQTTLGITALVSKPAYIVGATIATFLFVALSRILFRSEDLESGLNFISSLLNNSGGLAPYTPAALAALGLSIMLHFVPTRWNDRSIDIFVRTPAFIQGAFATGLVVCMLAFSSGSASFVYFQF